MRRFPGLISRELDTKDNSQDLNWPTLIWLASITCGQGDWKLLYLGTSHVSCLFQLLLSLIYAQNRCPQGW